MTQKYQNKITMDATHQITGEILSRPRFRTLYDNIRVRLFQTFDPDDSRTKQEFKDQCDVNKIWATFVKTGRTDLLEKAQGMYGDFTSGPQNYQEALNLVLHARETFASLPSDIRASFGNDVQQFMAAAHEDPDGLFDHLKALKPDLNMPATFAPSSSQATPEASVAKSAPAEAPPPASAAT